MSKEGQLFEREGKYSIMYYEFEYKDNGKKQVPKYEEFESHSDAVKFAQINDIRLKN